jgi:hypothetical protein
MASDDSRKEYREGPEAAERFDGAMNRLLKISKEELTKREATYQQSRPTKKPHRRRPSHR